MAGVARLCYLELPFVSTKATSKFGTFVQAYFQLFYFCTASSHAYNISFGVENAQVSQLENDSKMQIMPETEESMQSISKSRFFLSDSLCGIEENADEKNSLGSPPEKKKKLPNRASEPEKRSKAGIRNGRTEYQKRGTEG